VAPGQTVRLRYAAYPYQKFGIGIGVVEAIEQSPYAPQELPAQVAATLPSGEPVYRIVVGLDRQTVAAYGDEQPLKPGMVIEADIVQDRRRLVEWLLEPIYGLAGR
jgi:membrane fusion protein